MIKLSIIIPHYNSPILLIKLLKTIPDISEIETIVVDDSSSVCMKDVQQYLEGRTNVTMVANDIGENGAGTARNKGLELCNGEWVMFADADDFYLDGWYDVLKKWIYSSASMIYFIPEGVNLETGGETKRHAYYKVLVNEYIDNKNDANEIKLKTGYCTPWSKMFRLDVIKELDLKFSKTMVSNDIMFVTKYALNVRDIRVTNEAIYCVTRGPKTLTTSTSYKNFMVRSEIVLERYLYVKENTSDEIFKMAQMNRYIIERFVSCVSPGIGLKGIVDNYKLFRTKEVKCITLDLFSPFEIYKMLCIKFGAEIEKSK